MSIRTQADVAALEAVAVTDRIRHSNLADLLRDAASRHAGKVAIRYLAGAAAGDPVRDVTFDEVWRRVVQTANLLHRHGIGPHDTVTLLMPSVPETFFALWGAELAAIANPVNYFLEAAQIAGIMKQAGATAVIAADPSIFPDIWPKVEAIGAAMPGLKVFRVGGSASLPGVIDYEAACDAEPADRLLAPRQVDRQTIAALFHTGGTTGLPKLAKHTHGALTLMAWSNAVMFDLGPGTVLLNPLPQFHVGGSLFGALSPFANGWTIVIPTALGARNPNVVREYWGIVERNAVNIAGAVPTTLAAIMNVPHHGHDLSSLKVFVTGGSTVPVELIRRIESEIGVPVVEGYGMTEVHCYSTMNPMHGERRPGSVGLRLPYTEVRIADVAADGAIRRDCALGEIGHVLMRGPQITPGYLDPRHDRGARLQDGWLDSGDLGRLDADGYVWLTGRSKDLIIRGGHNIDPVVIEEALNRHPAVETAAAVGLPDTYAGELPMAFVQLRPGASATEEELREFCRREIPERAAVPVQVVPIPVMPLTGVGKIYKPALRLQAAQRAFEAALAPLRNDGVAAVGDGARRLDLRYSGGRVHRIKRSFEPASSGQAMCGSARRVPVAPQRRFRGDEAMTNRRQLAALLGATGLTMLVARRAHADDCRVMESHPAASAVIEGRSSEFFVRFDRPVDHVRSTLAITRDGKLVERLQPRLESAPEVLFARAATLPGGDYKLHWTVRTLAGTNVVEGDIPFAVKD